MAFCVRFARVAVEIALIPGELTVVRAFKDKFIDPHHPIVAEYSVAIMAEPQRRRALRTIVREHIETVRNCRTYLSYLILV